MPDIFEVANYFAALAAASEEEAGEVLTHLKLQKLLYYAQGFHLAIAGERLFNEDIEAWHHGPVVRCIWDRYQRSGPAPIPVTELDLDALTLGQRRLLDDVWNAYGQYSAWALRDMTHEEPPWRDAWTNGRNTPISDDALRRYFETQLVDAET